jgi:uncharacterized protein YkwD
MDRRVKIGLIIFGVLLFVLIFWNVYSSTRVYKVESWSGTISSPALATESVQQPLPVVVTSTSASSLTPSEMLAELNRHWLEKINTVRREKGLSLLVTDQRLVTTAGEWASEMERRGEITHERLDGKSMHQWIDAKQLDFTERHSEGGWKTNYFVENIARFYTELSVDQMKLTLDRILADFLSEGPGGAHYESIYYLDWNSVGLGYASHLSETEPPRVYFVFHYGSLDPMQP